MSAPAPSQAADHKISSPAIATGRSALVKRWTDRLNPALSASLLPELIRLTAEYLSVGCRFSKRLTSSEITIEDADEEGYGRTLSSENVRGWRLSSCEEPLSSFADAQGTVRWSVQHMS